MKTETTSQQPGTASGKTGTVYWFTGLAGAGKTTLGRLFYARLRQNRPNVLFLDGDVLREVFGHPAAHTLEERRALAMQYARLCRMLSDQGLDVVIATISLFHEVQEWNRKHLGAYREIFVRAPLEVLLERDQKQLYSRAQRGEISQVMGVDLPVEEPRNPDLILDNDGRRPPEALVEMTLATFKLQ